jgi:hypothetical protein
MERNRKIRMTNNNHSAGIVEGFRATFPGSGSSCPPPPPPSSSLNHWKLPGSLASSRPCFPGLTAILTPRHHQATAAPRTQLRFQMESKAFIIIYAIPTEKFSCFNHNIFQHQHAQSTYVRCSPFSVHETQPQIFIKCLRTQNFIADRELCVIMINITVVILGYDITVVGERGGVVAWGTMLQAGRSRVRIWIFQSTNPSSRPMVLRSTQPLTEMSTRNHPGG